MEDIQTEERLRAEQPRFAMGEFVSNVAMALVLGFIAWKAYSAIRPLIIDDSVPLPLIFTQTPTVEDHLPDGFISPDGFELAQSRFLEETPIGVRYWLLASTEEAGAICLYAILRSAEGTSSCVPLEVFAAEGVAVGYHEGDDAPGGEPYAGLGRYMAEEMELVDLSPEVKTSERFSFVEGPVETYEQVVASLETASTTGGRDLPEPEDS